VKPSQRIIDSVFGAEKANYKTVKPLVGGKPIGDATMKVLFDSCEARLMRYKKGATIPKHKHTAETLKFVLRGRIETLQGEQIIAGIGDYRCGGFEYGPWKVLEETFILVLQPPGTVAVPGKVKKSKSRAKDT
jgi:anti-sigma factor ChrR (cupin superfamily)